MRSQIMQCRKDFRLVVVLLAACLAIFLWDPNAVSLGVSGIVFLVGFAWHHWDQQR